MCKVKPSCWSKPLFRARGGTGMAVEPSPHRLTSMDIYSNISQKSTSISESVLIFTRGGTENKHYFIIKIILWSHKTDKSKSILIFSTIYYFKNHECYKSRQVLHLQIRDWGNIIITRLDPNFYVCFKSHCLCWCIQQPLLNDLLWARHCGHINTGKTPACSEGACSFKGAGGWLGHK